MRRLMAWNRLIVICVGLAISGIGLGPSAVLAARTSGQPAVSVRTGGTFAAFTRNDGQWDERALYRIQIGSATMWFTRDGVRCLVLQRLDESTGADDLASAAPIQPLTEVVDGAVGIEVTEARFENPDPSMTIEPEGPLDYKCNYFIGNDPAQWRTGVSSYTGIVYRNVYPGVDVRFENVAGTLQARCDTRGAANASLVRFRINELDSGGATNAGVVSLSEVFDALFKGRGDALPGESVYSASGTSCSYPALYDYILAERIADVAADPNSNAYITGLTTNPNFTTTPNAYDPTYNGGAYDVFVRKISPTGTLLYSTFIGGALADNGFDIEADGSGNMYVSGSTTSSDFPQVNPISRYFGGADAFVLKLNAAGSALIYSTFYGGYGEESNCVIDIDGSGNAYVAGQTTSSALPTASGAYDRTPNGGIDAFFLIFGPTGTSLYASVFGGSGNEYLRGVAADDAGHIYLAGTVDGITGFPTKSAYQDVFKGTYDGFVAKVTPGHLGADDLVYSTLLGGNEAFPYEHIYDVEADATGHAYVTGATMASDFPTTDSAFDRTLDGADDAFVTKLSPSGNSLVYSTFIGGSAFEEGGYAIAVDNAGCAYVVGTTDMQGTNVPTTHDACIPGHLPGNDNTWFAKLSSLGNGLAYSTMVDVGATGTYNNKLALDAAHNTFVAHKSFFNGDYRVKKFALACDCPYQADYDANGVVDADDMNTMIDIVFFNAPDVQDASCRSTRSDLNDDGYADQTDFNILTNYLFFNGPGWCNPCDPTQSTCTDPQAQ